MNPCKKHSKAILSPVMVFLFALGFLFAACSFDYSPGQASEKNKADIVMDNIEYVRVRGGDPLMRFKAEHAERWEDRQTMELENFVFEQLEDHGETINAEGRAGQAEVQLDSGDISLSGGVRINVVSEDVIIKTMGLEWEDKDEVLRGAEGDNVEIERTDGTLFMGRGFSANIRNRTWAFSGNVEGTYVETDDDEEDSGKDAASVTEWKRGEADGFPPVYEPYTAEEEALLQIILEDK